MPADVERLENLIDEVVQTDKWLQGTIETGPSLLREHWNFRANTSDNDKLFAAAVSAPAFSGCISNAASHPSTPLIQRRVHS